MTADALLGRTLGGVYRVDKRLGAGGIGAVYRATQVRTGRRYAVKVLLPEAALHPGAIERFRREAAALGALGHAGIVQLHDFDTAEDGMQFLVMELLEGEDLAARLATGGALPWATAVRVLEETASALAAAHDLGLVHRDLKPANIFLARRQGALERATLLDFGLARNVRADADVRLTATGAGLGTPLYMAPEQARGEDVDLRCDVYALGCVLYEMLTGAPPFDGPTLTAVLARILLEPPPRTTDHAPRPVPPGIDEVVRTALAKDPAQRYPSAQALVAAVHRAAAGFVAGEAGAVGAPLAATALAVTPDSLPPVSARPASSASGAVPSGVGSSGVGPSGVGRDAPSGLEATQARGDGRGEPTPVTPARGPHDPGGLVFGAPADSCGTPAPRPRRRRALGTLVGIAALAVAGLGVSIVALVRLTSPPAPRPSVARVVVSDEVRAAPTPPRAAAAPGVLDVAAGSDEARPDEEGADGPAPARPRVEGRVRPVGDEPARAPGAGTAEALERDAAGLEREAEAAAGVAAAQGLAASTASAPGPALPSPGAEQQRAAARQIEVLVRQRESEIAQLRAAFPLVQALRGDARALARLARPPSCADDRRRAAQEMGRGEQSTVAGFARRVDDLLERVCGFYDGWDTPSGEGRDKLQRFVTALDHAERMAAEVSATNQPRADAERVLAAIADVRRVVARVPPDGARFPCRDPVWGAFRDLRALENHWAAAAAGQVTTAQGRFCASTRMDAAGVEGSVRQLEDAASSGEQTLRAVIAAQEEIVARFGVQLTQYRAGAAP